MAMNLRLDPEVEMALRERSAAEGLSQQQLIRRAIDAYLANGVAPLVPRGGVTIIPAPYPYRNDVPLASLPEGVSSSWELLGRPGRY